MPHKFVTHSLALAAILFLVFAFGGCRSKKGLEEKPLRNRSANNILNRYEDQTFSFQSLSMRASVEVRTGDEKQSFKANIRMQEDAVIWVSIIPLMGLEMARVMVSPDSVQYISKVPNNKHYFKGTFAQLASMTGSELDFQMLQALLVGNAISLDASDDKFASRIDERAYLLTSRYNRKLKRMVGSDEKELSPQDSLEVAVPDRRYQRILRRADEEDLLVKRYWIDGDHFRVNKSIFDDLYYQRYIEVDHRDYKDSGGQLYPSKTKVMLTSPDGELTMEMEITRLKRYPSLDFPFDIPEDYERKFLP